MIIHVKGLTPWTLNLHLFIRSICRQRMFLSFPFSFTDREIQRLHSTFPFLSQGATDQIKGTKECCCDVGLSEKPGFPHSHVITEMAVLPKTYGHRRGLYSTGLLVNTCCCERATCNPGQSTEKTHSRPEVQCSKDIATILSAHHPIQ